MRCHKTADNGRKRPNVRNASGLQRRRVASVAAFNRYNGFSIETVGGIAYGIAYAAVRFGKTARRVGGRDRSGAFGRRKRRAVSGFAAYNVGDPRERNNVGGDNAGRVRGGGNG